PAELPARPARVRLTALPLRLLLARLMTLAPAAASVQTSVDRFLGNTGTSGFTSWAATALAATGRRSLPTSPRALVVHSRPFVARPRSAPLSSTLTPTWTL